MSMQRIWVFNGALCVLLVWGGMRLRKDWNAFAENHQSSRLENAVDRVGVKAPAEATSVAATDVVWTEIASRSPFSFDRNDISLDLTEVTAPQAPPPLGPKPILFGTLLLGNEPLALMARAGSRSGSPVKKGETLDGWEVVDIQHKSVVIASNGVRESLVVGRAPVERSSERTAAPSAPPPLASIPAPVAAPSQTTVTPSRSVNPTEASPGGVTTVFGRVEQDKK
jgi:hypothetical protein